MKKIQEILKETKGETLVEVLVGSLLSGMALMTLFFMIQVSHHLIEKGNRSVQASYDAFNQMGGQLSFCLALLDENNNGFIINSVHSTEGCYSYTKEIKGGECSISLGKEEEEALLIAMGR